MFEKEKLQVFFYLHNHFSYSLDAYIFISIGHLYMFIFLRLVYIKSYSINKKVITKFHHSMKGCS